MKKYNKPFFEIIDFLFEDVIAVSTSDSGNNIFDYQEDL